MADNEHVHEHSNESSGMGMGVIIGILIVVAIIVFLAAFGFNSFRQSGNQSAIEIPNKIDVNISGEGSK
ncbi:MAG: hypothetical protein COU27_01690 [Candidatus Levybacteria bacterium CG10_big_fil_rev_8_21_14_0_10_36_7]|nr:MAG: hypothetical protein COU27_01690 [Candidatus Levybacteria bacterium CG10_big_fil_rev_8_21_14_0_10_36_7]